MNSTISLRAAALAASAVLLLASCGEDTDAAADTAGDSGATTSQDGDAAVSSSGFSIDDPWVKSAESGMTAAFGTLVNAGSEPLTVVSAASDVASTMELHETVASDSGSMAMQPKEGGFTVEPGGTHELAPGGDHVMIMGLTRPVLAGEDVTITFTFDDGSTQEVTATAKDFSGAEEEYVGDSDMDTDMGPGEK